MSAHSTSLPRGGRGRGAWGPGGRAPDGFDRDVEIEGQGRDGVDALSGFDVGAGESDAVNGQGPERLIETVSS